MIELPYTYGPAGGGPEQLLSCDDGNRIDVIAAWTPKARETAALAQGGDPSNPQFIRAIIDLAVADANVALDNSDIETELRLVAKFEVQFDDTVGNICNHLDAVQLRWDGILNEVHALRDVMRGDLVSLVSGAGAACNNAIFGIAEQMRQGEESPSFEFRAFSLVKQGAAPAPLYTFAHELAHNMGCHHDRASFDVPPNPPYECTGNCSCWKGVFNDSFGHRFLVDATLYRTIMALVSAPLAPHFSNPSVTYAGVPTGVAAPSCNSADNARTITETRDIVAGFRKVETPNTTRMASTDYFYGQASGGGSGSAQMSGRGQFTAFSSLATNLGIPDTNSATDVFVYNRESGIVTAVSWDRLTTGTANNASSLPAISSDGHFISFASAATNLIVGETDSNNLTDVFLYDQQDRVIRRISVPAAGGLTSGGDSLASSMSSTGRYVAFESAATNLVTGDTNGAQDIFLRNLDVDGDGVFFENSSDVATTLVSRNYVNSEPSNGNSISPFVSDDGRYIAFASDASNLLGNGVDTNGVTDIFVFRIGGTTIVRVSVAPDGSQLGARSFAPSISGNGRYVAFATEAALPGDTNNRIDVAVHDRDTDNDGIFDESGAKNTFRVSIATSGAEGNADSYTPRFSANGRFVAFTSDASLVDPADGNGVPDVYLRDLQNSITTRVSIDTTGGDANGASLLPSVSGDGRFVAFESDATDLTPSDAGGFRDAFFRDRGMMLLGDLTGDGQVNAVDLDILRQNGGDCPCCAADLDGDGDVDTADEAILNANWTG